MNLIALAPEPFVWLLALLLVAAAAEDAVRMRISNLVSLAILLLGAIAAFAVGVDLGLWQNLAVVAALLALGTLLFSTGKFGGGDVKLLAAAGLWVDFLGSARLLAAVFLAGGVLAIIVIAGRMVAPASLKSRAAILEPGAGIPYGVAIAIGGLIAIALERLG